MWNFHRFGNRTHPDRKTVWHSVGRDTTPPLVKETSKDRVCERKHTKKDIRIYYNIVVVAKRRYYNGTITYEYEILDPAIRLPSLEPSTISVSV